MKTLSNQFLYATLILPIFCLFFLSCATFAPVLKQDSLKTLDPQITGVMLPIELENKSGNSFQDHCTFEVRKSGDISTKQFEAKLDDQFLFIELEPAVYSFKEIQCGNYHYDLLWKTLPAFQVKDRSIALFPPLKVKLEENRRMFTQVDSTDQGFNRLKSLVASLSLDNKKHLISAFTSVTIDLKAFDERPLRLKYEFIGRAPRQVSAKDFPIEFAQQCLNEEFLVNPLYLGKVIFDVTYQKKTPHLVKAHPTWSTSTTKYIQCLEKGLATSDGSRWVGHTVRFTF